MNALCTQPTTLLVMSSVDYQEIAGNNFCMFNVYIQYTKLSAYYIDSETEVFDDDNHIYVKNNNDNNNNYYHTTIYCCF
jgi:hypothetical protein